MHDAGGILAADRDRVPRHDGPGVEPGVHAHHADPGLGVARQDGALDGRRTAPARQQRRVNVEAAVARMIEHGLRQDEAVGRDHHDVRRDGQQRRLLLGAAEPFRLVNRHAMAGGEALDRARRQMLAAASGPVGLGEHQRHRGRRPGSPPGLRGEFRRAGE
jgi:hypothetical protein